MAQVQRERDELYSRFTKAIQEVQQKNGFKNLLLEKKLTTLADSLEKKVVPNSLSQLPQNIHHLSTCRRPN